MKHKAFKTSRVEDDAVKYWDKHFRKLPVWFDWLIVRTRADEQIPEIQKALECFKPEAREIVWGAFVSAFTNDDEDNPMEPVYLDFMSTLTPELVPVVHARLNIGADIFHGATEDTAFHRHIEWLSEGDNAEFDGGYQLTPNFEVRKL